MIRVDCQSHVFPEAYAELLTRSSAWVKTVRKDDAYVVTYGDGLQSFPIRPSVYDIGRKIEDMDRTGIDMSVLSINIPGPELLETELGIEGAQICNDHIAGVCEKHPERFVGLAVIPYQDVPAARKELIRAVDHLGLRGVMLYSHLNGKPVDSEEFDTLYGLAEEKRIPLVIHPTVPTWSEVIKDYSMIPMFGMMIDTSIAMLRLILGGVMERHPDLLIVHPHCGGVIPYLMPRIVEQTEVKKRGRENITKSPAEYYKRVYLDIVSPAAEAMQFAYNSTTPDRLLFGSDHPWVKIEALLDCIEGMDIPDTDKEMILGGNACRLFLIDGSD